MNIFVFQNLNILCSFWSTGFFFRLHIFWVDLFGLVFGSYNIGSWQGISVVHCWQK
jgi:hypothetical protein